MLHVSKDKVSRRLTWMLAPESTNSTKVYQLRALRRKGGGGATTWLKLRLWLVVDPCASSRGRLLPARAVGAQLQYGGGPAAAGGRRGGPGQMQEAAEEQGWQGALRRLMGNGRTH